MGERIVMHIDLDAFFASCEEVRRPGLKGKPVIVGADPRSGRGRGVVSTANYEARKYGIRSAMPISEAYSRCKHGAFMPPRFSHYKDISQRIFQLIRTFGHPFEQVGIDEGYLDLSQVSFQKAIFLGKRIRELVLQQEKLTCSVGIAPNKLLAKIASDLKKPNALVSIHNKEVQQFLLPLPVKKIPGIGPKTSQRLQEHHIHTINDLLQYGELQLQDRFGKRSGKWLYNIARGKDDRSIGTIRERKSIGAERTFMEDVQNHEIVYQKIALLLQRILEKMRIKGYISKTLVMKIRYEDFETHTVQKTCLQHVTSVNEALRIAVYLLRPFLQRKKKIRLIGVRFSKLEGKKQRFVQLCL